VEEWQILSVQLWVSFLNSARCKPISHSMVIMEAGSGGLFSSTSCWKELGSCYLCVTRKWRLCLKSWMFWPSDQWQWLWPSCSG